MKGQIIIDEQTVVICVNIGGKLVGGIDVADIPDEVIACPPMWKFENEKFIPNEGYSAIDLDEAKTSKIAESKMMLAEWLETHPYQYTDGKYYSVTEEKQALLNGNLSSYERATNMGIPYPLKWNSTGEECVDWEYSDLIALSLSIAGYVAPRVSAQQAFELQIKACASLEDLEKIVIAYE